MRKMKLIIITLLFFSGCAFANGELREISRLVSAKGDQATLTLFTLQEKNYTVLNLHYSKLRCMEQPVIMEGFQEESQIEWNKSNQLILTIKHGVNYKNKTDNGYISCKNTKIEIIIHENA